MSALNCCLRVHQKEHDHIVDVQHQLVALCRRIDVEEARHLRQGQKHDTEAAQAKQAAAVFHSPSRAAAKDTPRSVRSVKSLKNASSSRSLWSPASTRRMSTNLGSAHQVVRVHHSRVAPLRVVAHSYVRLGATTLDQCACLAAVVAGCCCVMCHMPQLTAAVANRSPVLNKSLPPIAYVSPVRGHRASTRDRFDEEELG